MDFFDAVILFLVGILIGMFLVIGLDFVIKGETISIETAVEAVCDSHDMVVQSYDGLDEIVCIEKPINSSSVKVFRDLGDD